VQFDRITCRWRALGEAGEVRRSDERSEILSVLTNAIEPLNPREIAAEVDMPRNNVALLHGRVWNRGGFTRPGEM
jgi:hypothetical protein